nr:PAS domain S-box protein [uncultured Methanoregula sp.]
MAEEIRVLYVDDEPGLLELTKMFLEQSGEFHVETSISAKEALASSKIPVCEAIVSDYQMPGMDGISFLKTVRKEHGNLPFILFTGRGREDVVIDAINNGADFYLQKGGEPIAQFAELAHKLRQSIANRRAQDQLRTAYEQIAASEEELREQYDELVRSEQQIRESEIKYRTLVEVNRDIVYSFDPNGTIEYMSPQTADEIGYRPDEMIGKNFTEFIHSDDVGTLVRSVQTNQNPEARIPSQQFRVRRKDGTYRWFEDKTLYTHDPQARPIFTGTLRDITERKNAEDALFDSRQMLQTVLDTIPQRVFWKDVNLVFQGCNRPLANDVGYGDPAEMIGKTDYDHSSAAIAEHFRNDDRMVMETGKPKINFEEPQIRPDGSTAWLRTSKVPLKSRDGATIGVLGTYEDITDAKRAQIALQESEAKYRDLTDSLPQIVFETDLNLRITYANRHALAVFGLSERDLADGSSVLSFIDPAQHADVRDSMEKLIAGTPFEPKEYTGLKKDGSRFPVLIYSSPVYRNKILAGFRGIVLDISARKKMEDGLRESEERFRSFVENADDVIFSVTPGGIFTYVSPRITECLGYSPGELFGQSFETLVHPDDRDSRREFFHREFLSGRTRSRFECRIRHGNGSWQVHTLTASPVHDARGLLVSVVGSIRDAAGSASGPGSAVRLSG